MQDNVVLPEDKSEAAPEETLKTVLPTADEALIKECAEYKLGWQRALADYKNLQNETARQRSEWATFSEQQILEEFIPVYDNFKKAFAHNPAVPGDEEGKKMQNWINGIGFIMKQFVEILKTHQVEEIKTVGEKFDPAKHEAVGDEPADGHEPGIIIRETDGGYVLGGRVIKVAKVIISK